MSLIFFTTRACQPSHCFVIPVTKKNYHINDKNYIHFFCNRLRAYKQYIYIEKKNGFGWMVQNPQYHVIAIIQLQHRIISCERERRLGVRCGSLELQINLNVGTTTLHKLEHNAKPQCQPSYFYILKDNGQSWFAQVYSWSLLCPSVAHPYLHYFN